MMLFPTVGEPVADVTQIVDCFMERNAVQPCTKLLLEVLKENKPEHGDLQTRLLEMNLISLPQPADVILGNKMFSHYDRQRVGQLCLQAGMAQRALEHFSSPIDIKRTIMSTETIPHEWLINFFGTLTPEVALDCLNAMLVNRSIPNIQLVAQIATKYHEELGCEKLISLFEKHKCVDGLRVFLAAIVNFSQDAEVHFKYIETATQVGNFKEVERVCRDSSVYEPELGMNFLMERGLEDQMPLIIVCDRHDRINDLVRFLHRKLQNQFIEILVQKVNPGRLPQVVGILLDTATWKEVCRVCVEKEEFSLAKECGMNLVLLTEELEQITVFYEDSGHNAELIELLEASLTLDGVHMGIFTTLACLYCKFNEQKKLTEFLELFWSRLNIPRVLRAAEEAHLWTELVFLYEKYEEYDNAVTTVLEHPDAFRESRFKEMVAKVVNVELYYKAMEFYLNTKPLLDLLSAISARLDHTRTVSFFTKLNHLPLVEPYLQEVQKENNKALDRLEGRQKEEADEEEPNNNSNTRKGMKMESQLMLFTPGVLGESFVALRVPFHCQPPPPS